LPWKKPFKTAEILPSTKRSARKADLFDSRQVTLLGKSLFRTGRTAERAVLASEEVLATAFGATVVDTGDLHVAYPRFGVQESFPLDTAVACVNNFVFTRHDSKPPSL
jgi:hypothetical protein